jgi:hypothetical protein
LLRTALGHAQPVRTCCNRLCDIEGHLFAALHLTLRRVDVANHVLIVTSLKKLRQGVYHLAPEIFTFHRIMWWSVASLIENRPR